MFASVRVPGNGSEGPSGYSGSRRAGQGVAVCQAAIEPTRKNQQTIFQELGKGTDPVRILELLKAQDGAVESRQFGILDLQGRSVGFSGSGNLANALSEGGKVGANIHYQMQGNILASDAVVHDAALAFSRSAGTLSERVMAAMEAADARGGDRRCTDGRTALRRLFAGGREVRSGDLYQRYGRGAR